MVAKSKYKPHYSLLMIPFLWRNSQQYDILSSQIQSSHKTKMDPCHNIKSYDPETVWQVDINFGRNFCFSFHQFQKKKLYSFGIFHSQEGE